MRRVLSACAQVRWAWVALLTLGAACAGESALEVAERATLSVRALTPATVRSLVVEISGPGIDPAQLVNVLVDSAGIAAGEIETTAGSGRRIVVTAVDTAGVSTHRGDTTVTLVAGPNPPMALVLRPLGASLGLRITFGALQSVTHRDITYRTPQ